MTTTIVWSAPLFDRSGFAEEARNFILALDHAGLPVRADPFLWHPWAARLSDGAAERIERLLATRTPRSFAHVVHGSPHDLRRHPRAMFAAARTMFETDGVPPGIVHCEGFDEIWVPSAFNVETFARAGVERGKLHAVPEPLDAGRYELELPALDLGLAGRFVFLSVFSWHLRKGWDVLVQAFLEEFAADEAVALALKFEPFHPRTPDVAEARRQLASFAWGRLGRNPAGGPPIVLLDLDLSDRDMPRLYRSADAYVMASRGEGWGRPYMEAMAMGLPTIGTRAGGNLDFMNDDNAYLVGCTPEPVPVIGWTEVPWYRDHRWAEPSLAELRACLRRVFEERGEGAVRGRRAREEVLERYRWERVAEIVAERLRAAGMGVRPKPVRSRGRATRILWEGPAFVEHSLAIVNREMCRAIIGAGGIDLALRSDRPDAAAAPACASLVARWGKASAEPEVHVRHAWPPDLARPAAGRFVIMQPWEFGSLPRAWAAGFASADEVWVPSRHVRDGFVRSGLDPERVVVIPNGVNPLRFNPAAVPARLPTAKRFRFLFVGGTLFRKGADVLLEAYLDTFGPEDDVCLVIKDIGVDSFYRGQGLGDQIRALQADPRHAEILYLDEAWPHDDLARLYTACHCLVHPYRAEGFGLPILEAMACGLPVIATGYGACLDFCDPSVSYLLPALEARSTVPSLGELETVEPPWWAEPDRSALVRAMRHVVEQPDAARLVGCRASEKALREFTWAQAADRILARLEHLTAGRPRPAARPRARLSVCMIVRDEAAFLRACLESVRGIADQVVVVDTGSTDGTPAIAEELGAELHHFAWTHDFAAARNESLRHATGEWILVLDGDEALDPESRDQLRRLVEGDAFVGYLVRIVNFTASVGTEEVVEHRLLRLFPNHPDLRFEGRDPHAQLVSRRPELLLPTRTCEVTVRHEGYRPQVLVAKGKLERNLVALERAVAEEPHHAFHAFNLGLTYGLLERSVEAERELLRAVALSLSDAAAGRSPPYLPTAYLLLAMAVYQQGRYAEAVAYCERSIALAPHSSDAHLAHGTSLLALGRLQEAQAAYERALQCVKGADIVATDRSTAGWKPFLGLAEVEIARRRWEAALAWLARAHQLAPEQAAVATTVARAALGIGDARTAEEILASVVERTDAPPEATLLLAELRGGSAPG
jgi:glycosyltransferase involved in cell wall biosynthesis